MAVGHVPILCQSHIASSEKVFFLVADPVTRKWISNLNPDSESLDRFYADGKPRQVSYDEMADHVVSAVHCKSSVCVAFYGHPAVFVGPSHTMLRKALDSGFEARMLPGISAEDCLFADLSIDPSKHGCLSYEATDFLIHQRPFDPRSTLVLWQVGVIGATDFQSRGYNTHGISILAERLLSSFSPLHEVIVYEASQYPHCCPRIDRVPLGRLSEARVTPISTLLVPPAERSEPDLVMCKRLRMI